MKRAYLIGLLIFSLTVNIAVAGVVAWRYWTARYAPASELAGPLSRSDLNRIRTKWGANGGGGMRQYWQAVSEKNAEILDRLAANPDNLEAVREPVRELIELRAEAEWESVKRLSRIMRDLPEEKRAAFLAFLKSRACMGPRHRGHGRGMRGGCPPGKGCPPGSGFDPANRANSPYR